jgi:hypothetical protein
MADRCSYHRLQADLHWYAHQQIQSFPACEANASRYAVLEVRYDGQVGTQSVSLCTGHELKVRELPGFKFSTPKGTANV